MAAPTPGLTMPYLMRYGALFDLNVTVLAKQCIIGLYDL